VKTQMDEKPESRDGMLQSSSKPVVGSLGGAAFENFLEKDCGKHMAHESGMSAVMADTTNADMPDVVHEASI
jgi:hypothetical protein